MKTLSLILTAFILTACHSHQTQPETRTAVLWKLNTEESQLSFISTKNNSISESHTIAFQGGQINNDMSLALTLDLNQVETQIPLRNQRMKELLFETETYPVAKVSAQIPSDLEQNRPKAIEFSLNLHGISANLKTTVVHVETNEEKMVVLSYSPVVIDAKDFGLDNGINQLTQVANLKAISYEVPVDFKLVFTKQTTNQ